MNEIRKIAYKKIDHEFSDQVKYFARNVIDEIFEYCEQSLNRYSLTEENIYIAINLILDLQLTLHLGEGYQTNSLYKCFHWNANLLSPWCKDDFFLDMARLDNIISQYLSFKWFSSATFEWYIINPYLRMSINNYRDFVLNRSFSTPTTLSDYCSTFMIEKAFGLILAFLQYVLPSYLILKAYEKDWIVISLLGSFGYVYLLISGVKRFIMHLACQRKAKSMLFKMVDLKMRASSKSWSPTRIMQLISEIDREVNVPELTPLVSKMIKRDPDIFNSAC